MKHILIDLPFVNLNGVVTFVYTFCKAAANSGRLVEFTVVAPPNAKYLTRIAEVCKIITRYDETAGVDEIWLNTFTTAYDNVAVPKYQFIHGIPKNHYEISKGVSKVFMFSERVFNYVRFNNKTLLRNGVDLDRFKVERLPHNKPKRVLIHGARNTAFILNHVLRAAKEIGCYVQTTGFDGSMYSYPVWEIEKELQKPDLVIAYGRSAIEAMSCGKPTIIYGINGGDGYVTKGNFRELMKTNFSGWSLQTIPKPFEGIGQMAALIHEFLKYNSQDGLVNRALVERYFDINGQIDKVLGHGD